MATSPALWVKRNEVCLLRTENRLCRGSVDGRRGFRGEGERDVSSFVFAEVGTLESKAKAIRSVICGQLVNLMARQRP